MSASTTTLRSRPGLEAVQRAAERGGKPGALDGQAAEGRPGHGERAREGDELAELGLGQPVAARALAPAPVAIRRQRSPAIRVHACGPRPTPPALNRRRVVTRRRKASTAASPTSATRRARRPRGSSTGTTARIAGSHGRDAEPVGEARLGRHLDGVGADDRRGREIEPRDRHLQAAQRHDHLDLAVLDVAAGLELVDRGREVRSSSEKSVLPIHSRQRKARPASSARWRGSSGTPIPIRSR